MYRRAVSLHRLFAVWVILIFVGACTSQGATQRPVEAGPGSQLSAPVPTEPQGPLVPLDVAQSKIPWKIQIPSYTPVGVTLQGVLADTVGPQSIRVRIHYSDGVVLLEGPSTEVPPPTGGRTASTTVNGHPGIAVDVPPPQQKTDPVAQVAWWTGSMFFDIYGAVDFQEVRQMADSLK